MSETGLTPFPRHVAAVQSFPPPQDIKQLQRFLGFLPSVVQTLKPLTDLLRGCPKTLEWSAAAEAAFQAAKSAPVDASDSHVGGVLQQLQGRAWRPLAFF